MAVKKTTIGQMRKVGHFENNTNPIAYTAGYVDSYTNVVTSVYCKLWQSNHNRANDFGQVQVISSWKMQCRFQDAIDINLLQDTKFVQGDRRFTIAGFEVIDERDFYYEFTLNLINL